MTPYEAHQALLRASGATPPTPAPAQALRDPSTPPRQPEHAAYPHEPGYLYDCPACEARCHCTPDTTTCVYEGKHHG